MQRGVFGFFFLLLASSTCFLLLTTVEPVRSANTVGRPCSNDTECLGSNEVCAINTQVDPPCTTGFCTCKHCYTLDANLGACEPTIYKTLNDDCREDEMGHSVLPKNAQCTVGIVLCRNHHAFIDGACVRVETNGDFGQPCGSADPCDHDLVCGAHFSECVCPDPSKKWDSTISQCVSRDVGDFCTIDDECVPQGDMTALDVIGSMVCSAGTCQCAPGLVPAQSSFIDTRTNLLVTKTVCQGPNSTNSLAQLAKCSKGLAFAGSPINTCDVSMTCFQCPEDLKKTDFTNFDGLCRGLGTPVELPLCPGQVAEKGRKQILNVGSVGNPCNSNSECTGANEICTRNLNIDPPCLRGVCGCMPGYVPNMEAGNICVIKINRALGEQCNALAETAGVSYPDGADCINGTIRCKAHRQAGPDGNCIRFESTGWIDSPCKHDSECESDLVCPAGRCTCGSAYKWVATGIGRCVGKDIGDACFNASDCASASAGGSLAVCINSMCACPPGTTSIAVNEFDPTVDSLLSTHQVCVTRSSNISAGAICNLDLSSNLCTSPLACYKCPDEKAELGTGICRKVTPTPLVTNTKAPPPPSAKKYNTVGKVCRSNYDCSRNEMCNVATFIDPPCLTGICVCRPCYAISAQSSQCELATYHIIGDTCRIGEIGTFFPPNSECNNGIVLCKPHFSPSATGACVRSQMNGYYGAPCRSRTDCDNGLTCGYLSQKCTCPSSYMRWDPVKERCIKREYGDECSADGDCTVHGNIKEGFTYYGGACSTTAGHCVCANGYVQTTASFVDIAMGQYSKRTICVQSSSTINVDRGGTCQTDPVFSSDSRIYVCSENSICFHCPEDSFSDGTVNANIGKCRNLLDVPPNPQCFPWLPTTANRSTTTTPRPTIRITTTTTPSTTTPRLTSPAVAKIYRVGTICTIDLDCGYNEYCANASVSPPCLRGICQCKPCHAQDDITHLCMPVMQLFLGEGCANSSTETYPPNAVCKSGLVTCKSCYKQSNTTCVKTGSTKLGDPCKSVCDCDSNMFCNQKTMVCECFHAYEKWDAAKNMCIRREFGDTCTNNVECDVFGANSAGYTYSGGQCISTRCSCDQGYSRVVTGFIANPTTGEMGEKAICVVNTSLPVANRNRGDRCNLDPIWFSGDSDALSSGICGSKQICFQCPDDTTAAGNDGKCRIATPQPAAAKCIYQRPSKALPPPTPPATPQLSNTVGFPCSRDAECSMNEQCVTAAIDPPCQKGLCACKSCYAIGVTGICSQYIQLYLGDYCDDVPNEHYPTNASCQLGIVSCKPCFLNQNGKCVRATALRPYGARCISDCDCDGTGTYCEPDSGTCMCRQYYEKWDALNQRCKRREFGDSCTNDAQCQVRGQSGEGYTYSGGACVLGRCVCGQRYTRTLTSFFVDPATNQVTAKTLCLRDGIEVNRTKGQACAVDPIYNSDDVVASLGSCNSNSFCFQCPDDLDLPNFRITDGLCRNIITYSTRIVTNPFTSNTTSPKTLTALGAATAPQDCFTLYRSNNYTRGNVPLTAAGFGTSALPPRIAGGSYVSVTKGFIMDLLLEHGENRPFASFQLTMLRPCTNIADCRPNESCVVPDSLATGFCACQPPNFLGADGACRTVGSMPTASSRTPTTWVRLRIGT